MGEQKRRPRLATGSAALTPLGPRAGRASVRSPAVRTSDEERRQIRTAAHARLLSEVLDRRATRQLPYAARRELLASLDLEGPAWRAPHHHFVGAEHRLAATAEQGLEGVVAKRLDAAYRAGRSRAWIKQKHRRRERLAVSGWREREGSLPELLLARLGADGRVRAGCASLGLDADQRTEPLETSGPRRCEDHAPPCPLGARGPPRRARGSRPPLTTGFPCSERHRCRLTRNSNTMPPT